MPHDLPPLGKKGEPFDPSTALGAGSAQGKSRGMGLFLSLRLAWNLGFIIAIPVFLFGFGGAYLDKRFSTSPIFVITGFVLAIVLSGVGVYRKVKEILVSSE